MSGLNTDYYLYTDCNKCVELHVKFVVTNEELEFSICIDHGDQSNMHARHRKELFKPTHPIKTSRTPSLRKEQGRTTQSSVLRSRNLRSLAIL
jgi:hypothetical protein